MKIVVAICGVPVTVFGLLLVGMSCYGWYENGGLSYFKYHDLSTLPSYFFWLPFLGIFLAITGGVALSWSFRGQWLAVNAVFGRRRHVSSVLFVMFFLQCAILLFQVH